MCLKSLFTTVSQSVQQETTKLYKLSQSVQQETIKSQSKETQQTLQLMVPYSRNHGHKLPSKMKNQLKKTLLDTNFKNSICSQFCFAHVIGNIVIISNC